MVIVTEKKLAESGVKVSIDFTRIDKKRLSLFRDLTIDFSNGSRIDINVKYGSYLTFSSSARIVVIETPTSLMSLNYKKLENVFQEESDVLIETDQFYIRANIPGLPLKTGISALDGRKM